MMIGKLEGPGRGNGMAIHWMGFGDHVVDVFTNSYDNRDGVSNNSKGESCAFTCTPCSGLGALRGGGGEELP